MADTHPQFFHTYYIFLKLNMDHLYKVLCFTKTVINYNKAIILYHGYFHDFVYKMILVYIIFASKDLNNTEFI